jgi:hypothetical protein
MSQNVPLPAKEALQKFCSSGIFFKVQELISSLRTNVDEVTTLVAMMNFIKTLGIFLPLDFSAFSFLPISELLNVICIVQLD